MNGLSPSPLKTSPKGDLRLNPKGPFWIKLGLNGSPSLFHSNLTRLPSQSSKPNRSKAGIPSDLLPTPNRL